MTTSVAETALGSKEGAGRAQAFSGRMRALLDCCRRRLRMKEEASKAVVGLWYDDG
jgi:hypothetical protein